MAIPIIMPKFSMTQEEATVVQWLVAEGDSVEKGDLLMEVETDKITMDVEAMDAGVLRGLTVKAGDVVPVTEVIGYIVPDGETWEESAEALKAKSVARAKATPVAQRMAKANMVDIGSVPSSNGQRITRRDVEAFLQTPVNGNDVAAESDKLRATPAARRIAREREVDLAQISGSGPKGRIQAEDVAAYELPSPQVEAGLSADIVPFGRMRHTIAERMTQNYQEIPHITFTISADMTATLELRQRINAHAERDGSARISVTAVLVKVCGWALQRHPLVNASWHDDGIEMHDMANIGVAVALEDGLIVPVVHDAGRKGLSAIAAQVNELTEKARFGRLQPAEVQGGTFTISNLGMFGIDQFTAIINAPQSAILAVGRTKKEAVVIDDAVEIRPMMTMTLSVDHRIIDGAVAARFLHDIVQAIEQPDMMLW
ncbi:MAG: 2-oxo acid dehydrogenase subunit E2 [Anaerolineae bacterium]|nr:2-oxo acid dehydrogenase subunit E2 [Anaerolineae bacterium]